MQRISAIVITRNEGRNVELSLASLVPICSRIIVVDSESDDRTVTPARTLTREVRMVPRLRASAVPALQGFLLPKYAKLYERRRRHGLPPGNGASGPAPDEGGPEAMPGRNPSGG